MFKFTKMPIGYLWKKKDRNDVDYLAGVLILGFFEIPIAIFPETKRNERGADYVVKIPPDNQQG